MGISVGGPSATNVAPVLRPQKAEGRVGGGKDSHSKPSELDAEQQKTVNQLKARDQEVRAHEAAHLAAAGGIAHSGANFTYQRGPDGQLYAVGGEVSIDASAIPGDPEATIRKAAQIRRAALAPAMPSAQDLSVASGAAQMETQAYAELARHKASTSKTNAYSAGTGTPAAGSLIDAMA